MNTCGIITEYNPMHLGHAYQLNEAKSVTNSDTTVLVMSGNFVQRGEPALLNKYQRATVALKSGIDLVIEMPTYFATSSAEFFAHQGVEILNALGVVTHINYGSESGSIKGLTDLAEILYNEPLGYSVLLNDFLKEGVSFPVARTMALKKYNENHQLFSPSTLELIETPNNILGIEYIKALKRLKSPITPTTIKRIGSTYHNDNSHVPIPSATAVRKHLKESEPLEALQHKLPEASYNELNHAYTHNQGPLFYDDIFPQLKYKILSTGKNGLSVYQDVTEGLENRIYDAAIMAASYDELIREIETKRFTRTKIARALLHIYMNHTKETFNLLKNEMKPYIRVLGFSPKGQLLLKSIKKYDEELPIIVNVRQGYKRLDDIQKLSYMADLNSTLLYNHLIHTKYGVFNKNDYQHPVIMI